MIFYDESFHVIPINIRQKLYEDMKSEIESVVARGKVPENVKDQHRGFLEWNPQTTKQDHQSIVQVSPF